MITEEVVMAAPEDRANLYMEFIKEAPYASNDTRKKMRKRLGI